MPSFTPIKANGALSEHQGTPEQRNDPQTLIALLSVDYPLIDSTLILALVSDYDDPVIHIEEIRDQLGVLEATLVPDPDLLAGTAHSDLGDLDSHLGSLGIDDVRNGPSTHPRSDRWSNVDTPPTSILPSSDDLTSTSSDSGSKASKMHSPDGIDVLDGGFTDEMELLKSLFPSLSESTIQEALLSEPSLPAAIDHLLSCELVRQVEIEGDGSGESSIRSDEEDWKPHISKRKDKSRNGKLQESPSPIALTNDGFSKTARKAKNVPTPLVDTLQRRNISSASSSRSTSNSRAVSRTTIPSGPSSNAWGTVASLSSYLADLLNQPQNHFSSFLHAPQYHSASSAIYASLESLSRRDEIDEIGQSILQEMYADLLENDATAWRDLQLCVKVSGDVATVMDLMDFLEEISHWPGQTDDWVTPSSTGLSSPIILSAPTSAPMSRSSSLDQPALPVPAYPSSRMTTRPESKSAGIVPKGKRPVPGSTPGLGAVTNPTATDSFGLPSSFAPLYGLNEDFGSRKLNGKQVHPQNWRPVEHARKRGRGRQLHPLARNIPSYARGQTPQDPTPGSLYRSTAATEAMDMVVERYYAKAAAERAKREEAIRAAATHFTRGQLPGGKAVNASVAGHYAAEARQAADKAREWEVKAARVIVTAQLDRSAAPKHVLPSLPLPLQSTDGPTAGASARSGPTIDLHHLTVDEATTVALEMVERWYEREKSTGDRGLVIVTGVGRHSKGHVGVLGPAVAKALEQSGWKVDRGEAGRGYLVVKGKS